MLHAQRQGLERRLGAEARLVAVCDSRGCELAPAGLDAPTLLEAKAEKKSVGDIPGVGHRIDTMRVVVRTAADAVVQTSPSDLKHPRPALDLDHLLGAMRAGKHAVSVNMAPLTVAMPALLESARYNRVSLAYSGTVGAATPVLSLAARLATGDRITGIRAIIKGTTNFILSRMAECDQPFDVALAHAVKLGYAEADPGNDIDGIDTAMKLVILANHAGGVGKGCSYGDVSVQGIRGLPVERVREARARGKVIKLIGSISEQGLWVAPAEVDVDSPLNVPRNMNAVTFSMHNAGDVSVVGRGAGGAETATAIVRDLIEIGT